MNERIRLLWRQAVLNNTKTPMNFQDAADEFAELIVAEAIAVVQRRFMGDLNREDMEVRRCVEDVKKHFGVEA